MRFYGYKIRIACANWEQVKPLGKFWSVVTAMVGHDEVVGLGMDWSNGHFTYAMGSFDKRVVSRISEIKLKTAGFDVEYIEVELPEESEWTVFEGKEKDLQKIYDKQVDGMCRKYDYELELFDGNGNLKLMIHFMK